MLDVGCGRGIAVKSLRSRGFDCSGVELAGACPLAGVGDFIRTGISAADLPAAERARIGVLLFLDVIEHFADPAGFLRTVLEGFPRVTCVVITVPARPELWSNYDDFYGHHKRYTLRMVEDLAGELGWQTAWRSYFFRMPYLAAKFILLRGQPRPLGMQGPRRRWKWLHGVIAWLSVFEYLLLPRGLPGTSIIACLLPPRRAGAGQ